MVQNVEVYLERVRSFAVVHRVPIRPLTLLVGENSSGKSTFLAIAACVFDKDGFPLRPRFNDPPFNLGTFETIATWRAGRNGKENAFTIGFSRQSRPLKQVREVKATYRQEHGLPALVRYEVQSELASVLLTVGEQRVSGSVTFANGGPPIAFDDSENAYKILTHPQFHGGLYSLFAVALSQEERPVVQEHLAKVFLMDLEDIGRSRFDRTFAFAPIRTRPKRTYDELAEDYSPEGDHIPTLLSRVLTEERRSEVGDRIVEALTRFGAESGLFKKIEVKKLGKAVADPFQVQVVVGAPKANLVDVGYGVSQALPVIVQSVLREQDSLFLIQQPEIHLHPRAQAALGTFFAELAAPGRNTYVIETHSDFLVDRIRQEVARGTIQPHQVQILFFDRPKAETNIYPIEVDAVGNIVGAPEQYRDFFLEEELRLMGRGGA